MFVGDTPKYENAVGRKLQGLLKHAKAVSAAVAYVRSDPAAMLGLSPEHLSNLVLVCDPYGGGCNPIILDKCRARGVSIRFLKGLHSKVFITETALVTGSANLSQVALGSGNCEAICVSTEVSEIEDARQWFSIILRSAIPMEAVRANPLLWGQIVAAWKQNLTVPRPHGVDILTALRDPYHHAMDQICFSLISDWDTDHRAEAMKVAKTSGLILPPGWDSELMESGSTSPKKLKQVGSGKVCLTLYVKVDDAETVTRFVALHHEAQTLSDVAAHGTKLFLYYVTIPSPYRIGARAGKSLCKELNAALQHASLKTRRRLGTPGFTESAVVGGLLSAAKAV
jgi:hypothetical protein